MIYKGLLQACPSRVFFFFIRGKKLEICSAYRSYYKFCRKGLFTYVILNRWAARLKSTMGDTTPVAMEQGGMSLMTELARATDEVCPALQTQY